MNVLDLLTHKPLEIYGCVISTVATDALVPKHHTISIHNADLVSIVLPKIHKKNITFTANNMGDCNLHFEKKIYIFQG